jgi:hypothetical protein
MTKAADMRVISIGVQKALTTACPLWQVDNVQQGEDLPDFFCVADWLRSPSLSPYSNEMTWIRIPLQASLTQSSIPLG